MYRPLPLRTLDHGNFKSQLLKWVGNKQRVAAELISYFPPSFNTYIEPFVGSGAVLGTLAPKSAIAGDIFAPLVEIWKALKDDPERVITWYQQRYNLIGEMGKVEAYKSVLSSYNRSANGADLLFLSRTCYGGVIRFRKSDGFMSTPCGPHTPMPPDNFAARAYTWHRRVKDTQFHHADYRELMERANPGDLIYCDPPYVDSQSILYGAQDFRLSGLFDAIAACKKRGAYVALSIDGTKKSGSSIVRIDPPKGLFEREALVNCGRSMLRRFQMDGQTLESELVADRLLLTY
ncbi:DNA adenine methylase [Xanthomonas phaseoli]|uniref:DNA adenine methylase n=1 Tax=Xanthomonas phaseoli TaxID=1985254 RepID=UPI001E458371|nr:Dam family site-specific DNA-(adenine-N6)-methyltransferase [Xanthomonas phaseoli]MCC8472351.1 Dam family site-specific DNA-(adenine-N6)-methyltransferase [Xanthomonas phaseoli]